jgi:hypothetical protein
MSAVQRLKGCPRCSGDLFEEPGTTQDDRYTRYLCCLQCGELRALEPRISISAAARRARPGRPRRAAG